LKEAAMWCYYNNDVANGAIYGKLYNWYAAKLLDLDMESAGFGWRVPTSAQFTTLANALGGASVAGGKMKMTGLDYWNTPNTGATNESGFTGLGGGIKREDALNVYLKQVAFLYTSENINRLGVIDYNSSSIKTWGNYIGHNPIQGASIRLIKS
jgi:uncharacterized protein (TIGR02145 family)